jgi:hypothetical protein
MATNVTFNGVTYSVPAANEEGWQALSTYLIALAGASVSGGSQSLAVRVATTATVTAATSDAVILINRAGAVTVNLPAGVDKQVLWIGDISGAAETNNITINRAGANTIFGGTSYVLNQNNQVACFIFSSANGNWNRIAESKLPANGAAATLLKSDGTKLIYAKLVDADVDPTAAIARAKLASGSAAHVIINDGSGVLSSEALLAVTRGGTGVATSTGSGSNVLSDSPVLVTPDLGTPSAVTLTNAIGLPIVAGTTGTLSVARGGTGVTSSTGTGNTVLSNSPTLVTPALGTPASGVMTNVTGLPLTTGVTGVLPVANGGTGLSALGSALQFIRVNAGGTALEYATVAGTGDVSGPSGGVVDNEIVLFASTTGKAIKGAGGALTLSTGLTIGGTNGVVLTAADSTGAGSIRLRSDNASASARDWGFLLDANIIGGLDLYVSATKNGNPNAGINILTISSSLLRVVDIQTQFVRNTNQIILGSTNTTTINSVAPSASRVYTIPDAGGAASFVMTEGTQTIGGALTLPATVNYTGVGSIVKAGAGALTLSASGAFTLTVPATGTANLIDVAQTISAIKTHSAAIAFTGGSAANGSIWFASNVLRQRGGTSGWAVDNTSGAAIISTTDTGAITIGLASTGTSIYQTVNGSIVGRATASQTQGIFAGGTIARLNANSYFDASGNTERAITTQTGYASLLINSSSTSTDVALRLSTNHTNAQTANSALVTTNQITVLEVTQAGALTVGPTTADISHRIHAGKATSGPVLIVQGYGTAGAYFNISEEGVQDWYIGMDNSSSVLKFRPTSTVTGSVAEVTTAGAWTFGPSSGSSHTRHLFISRVTNATSSDAIVISQFNIDGDATGGRYFQCQNSAGTEVGRIEAASATTTSFTGSSDSRLKHKESAFTGLDKVLAMQPKEYEWKSNPGKRDKGFYAQELFKVYPEAVSVGTDELTESGALKTPWGIDYGRLTPVLVKAIQELHAELQALKAS